ncbi:MAG: hypothetical protein H4O13_08480 [Xanthomonadales bacterium]|nr:hypothetical protein [Xanthomonadales bacterium]
MLNTSPGWKQRGKISLWRYTENQRNFPGWHLNADGEGCASLLDMIDALRGHLGSERNLRVSTPTPRQLAVPNNRAAAWIAPQLWMIQHHPEPEHWHFAGDLEPATLVVGAHGLDRLREGVAGIPAKQGDYSIGAGRHRESRLWFWWGPG